MRRLTLSFIQPYWYRVAAFLVVMFFILLSDAVLSDFVPGYIQGVVKTPLLMGLIMAFSSLVGVLVDLIFPQLLKGAGVRKLAGLAMLGSLVFLTTLYFSTWAIAVLLLIVGMAAWGVYYELDSFMTKQFVADTAPVRARGAVWGVVGVFRNLAYFLGPLLGTLIASRGERAVILMAGTILVVAYLFFLIIKLPKGNEEEESGEVNAIEEIKHWILLGKRVWPVLAMSLLAGIVDATYWTTGTVVNDTLAEIHPWGGWFLSAYMLPSLFVGFVIAKWGIYQGKKKWAETFLLLGGLVMMTINLSHEVPVIIAVVLLSSMFLALAWPLVDATYSDFTVRMKKGRKHMIGMSSSVLSLAYVIGPILAGYLAGVVGELTSFVWIGFLVTISAVILLFVTPKKIKLPETEIKTWE